MEITTTITNPFDGQEVEVTLNVMFHGVIDSTGHKIITVQATGTKELP
jgi:hypothetical protein